MSPCSSRSRCRVNSFGFDSLRCLQDSFYAVMKRQRLADEERLFGMVVPMYCRRISLSVWAVVEGSEESPPFEAHLPSQMAYRLW